MAFGFFKKDKGPIEITCPKCQNRQKESPLAVSTLCKKCHTYLKIVDQIAIAKEEAKFTVLSKPAEAAEAKPSIAQETKPPIKAQQKTETPSAQTTKKDLSKKQAVHATKLADAFPPRKKPKLPPRPIAPLLQKTQDCPNPDALKKKAPPPIKATTISPKIPPAPDTLSKTPEPKKAFTPREAGPDERLIICFECGTDYPVARKSTSGLCPKCGSYISLKNYEIKENFNSRIKTRGTVFIYKKGIVSSSIIHCHDLTVEGEFTGAAECSGTLIIRRHSHIEGHVKCRNLLIEKRAKVSFLKGVETERCEIDGIVDGNIHCSQHLALHKKATLHGDIKVKTLSIDEGAKHHGKVTMGG